MDRLRRLAAAIVALWATRQLISGFDLWSDPGVLVVVMIVALPTCFLVVGWLLRRIPPESPHHAARWLLTRPAVTTWRMAHPRLVRWTLARLASGPGGWPATLLLAVAVAAGIIGVGSVGQDILTNEPAARVDVRLLHLLATFRSLPLGLPARVIAAGTNAAVLSLVGLWLALARLRHPVQAIPLLAPSFATALALLAGPLFPHVPLPIRFAVIAPLQHFPSPALAAVAALLLACLLAAWPRRWWSRALLAASAVLALGIVMVAWASLGAAWFTDLWGGVLLGSGTVCLLAASSRWLPLRGTALPRSASWLAPILVVPTLLVGALNFPAAQTPFLAPAHSLTSLPARVLDATVLARLPHWSETMTGRRMVPVSLVLAGSQAALQASFARAGWVIAVPITLGSSLRIATASLRGRPDSAAPVSPDFLNGYPEDWAVERATDAASARARHHARFWSSGFLLADGTPVWIGTASLDTNLELAPNFKFPTHHIDPAIDLERDTVALALEQAGVHRVAEVQLVPPIAGTNAEGDLFFTYGQAIVLDARQEAA